jgi:hypothetical protein
MFRGMWAGYKLFDAGAPAGHDDYVIELRTMFGHGPASV